MVSVWSFCSGIAAGVAIASSGSLSGSWWFTRSAPSTVECYRSLENSLHFKKAAPKVFSGRLQPYVLGQVIPITHDVALFRFLLPNADDEFNLKPCSTLQACYKYGVQITEQCYRFYTPVTANHTKGYFDIIVKRKEGGLMTKHLFGMHIGDKLLFRCVAFKIQYKPNRWSHIGMIAGGTGFTPMLQIICHALTEPLETDGVPDSTKLSFLFCNRTERHILLKGLFDELARTYAERFRMFYTVDQTVDPSTWTAKNCFVGYVTPDMVRQTMPAPDEPGSIVMLCGPDHLLHHVAGTPMHTMATMSSGAHVQPSAPDLNNLVGLGGVLAELGYQNDKVYRF